ncbi:amidohydrolase [Corynebacterium otitidis]|uniref:amidohydrolase n=1 Tax=Corynebacterium otitidis TaxID=29321 RepID=UPI000627E48F|nr:amidohydrolase [Corynebacterium otitidis]KKO84372.1 N-acyl-L-amino acid amidohydrolase [Corynebacterium otitidis]
MSIQRHVALWCATHREELRGWRRWLHAHPELSHDERKTTAFLAATLREAGLEPRLLPGTGLTVDLGPEAGPRLAFRADIDALPIQEETGLGYSSRVAGVAHACGHDVHATVALVVARALAEAPLERGVRVIFQPAEEVLEGGAVDLVAAGVLEGVEAIFALHVDPSLEVGTVGVRDGAITSATDVVEVEVTGPGGHTSRPHQSADVVFALGSLITQLPALLSRRVDPRSHTVFAFGSVAAGEAFNAIPKSGRLTGTMRTGEIEVWRGAEELVGELVDEVVAPTGCAVELTYRRGVPPVVNDRHATSLAAAAAGRVARVVRAPQSSGGEDFSWYLDEVPGSMLRLGSRSPGAPRTDLHSGLLVVDERAIEIGAVALAGLVDDYAAPGR